MGKLNVQAPELDLHRYYNESSQKYTNGRGNRDGSGVLPLPHFFIGGMKLVCRMSLTRPQGAVYNEVAYFNSYDNDLYARKQVTDIAQTHSQPGEKHPVFIKEVVVQRIYQADENT